MEYKLEINGESALVDVEAADGKAAMVIDEAQREVQYKRLPDNSLWLNVDGRGVRAYVAPTETGGEVFINGRVYEIADADKAPSRKSRGGADQGPGEVTPPMPAVVVRVSAAVGDRVEKGQGLVVVSAMKMETTLCAPYSGMVTAVNTQVDAKVMPGEILVDIEADEKEEDSDD